MQLAIRSGSGRRTIRTEASLIVADIEKRLRDGCPPEEIAILTRTHAQMRPIEALLLKVTDLPFVIVGGVAFFGREEVRDIMAYLRVARTDDDALHSGGSSTPHAGAWVPQWSLQLVVRCSRSTRPLATRFAPCVD